MGDWLTLAQIARYWDVSEDEARSLLIRKRKPNPKPTGEIYVEDEWLDRIKAELQQDKAAAQ